jgi:pyruvate,water dikinase
MEWAWASGRLLVLQSRPITSLFPLPEGLPAEPLGVFFSVGAVQGMLDPLTPLGRDLFALLAAGIAGHFGRRPDQRNQRSFAVAGGRLFINFTPVVGSRLGRNFIELGLPSIDPVSAAIFRVVLTDPRLPGPGRLTRRSVRGLAGFAGAVARTALATQLAPAAGRRRFIRQTMAILDDVRRHCAAAPDLATLVDELVAFTDRMTARLLPRLVGAVVSGQAPYQILQRRMAGVPGAADLAMEITRGLAHNVTSQMDLELWRVSRAIAADPAAGRCFREADAAGLAADCLAGRLPAVAQAALGAFLGRYGSRGVGEIDLGRPRWREDPTGLCQTLQSYLKIPATASPEAVFARGAEKAAQAATELVALCRSSGRLPGWLARFLVDRFRQLGGLRESPKFFIVRLFGEFRQALLAQGGHLMAEGRLDQPDDLVYLRLDELRSLATGEAGDWKPLVAARRTELAREARRPRVPRVFLSDGTAWYDAPAETGPGQPDDGCLRGSPVSAGTVEGLVRVITDPRGARLEPGEILVCPATDPAWTPLFLAAGGLVMEVGGLMTHGSVVAREYGIPAVVGVSQATSRLRTGQRLRLDGSTGRIQLLD